MGLQIRRQRSLLELLERRQLLSTIYVDAGATGSTHDGTSWETAFTDLQSALTIATSGDRVDVAGGTYKPTSGTDRTISFRPTGGVSIYGGYAGSASSDPDARDPATYPTILSGDIGAQGDNSDNSYHVIQSSSIPLTLDGLTITDGNADGSNAGGGGLYDSAIVNVNNCNFIDNVAQGNNGASGGAVNLTDSISAVFTDCNFDGNSAIGGAGGSGIGGAITFTTVPSLSCFCINCAFVGNSADLGGAVDGIYTDNMIDCTFVDNPSAQGGGATSNATVKNSIIWGDLSADDANSSSNVTYSDVDVPTSGSGNINVDPNFVSNPSPGTDGIWGTSDDDYGNLQLQPTSPCIDAGNNTDVSSGTTTDLAGNPRFIDMSTVTGAGAETAPIVDMGAYEALPAMTASAGGPYSVMQGQSIILNGSGLSNVAGALQYAWDFTGNGQYADATGSDPTFSATLLTTPGDHTIALQVTNADGQSAVDTTTVDVTAATVQADAGGPYSVVVGKSLTLAGTASTNVNGSLQYGWDFTGNGQFTDATSANPIFSAANISVPTVVPISLRVTNSLGQTSVANTTVNVEGAVIYVDLSAPGPDTGADWAHAFTNLSDALNQAVAGQTIRVAAGTYYPTNAADRTASFNLKNGVEIDGGYAGDGAADPDSRRLDPNYTILSGNIGSSTSDTDNSYNVVTGNNVDATAILDGITIRDGHANGSNSQGQGGGIYLNNASPTIENCFIYDNFASTGGGIYDNDSSPALTNSFIENNTSSGDGAGMFNESSSPTITGCQFNTNNVTGSGSGGAMANEDSSTPVITDSFFSGNHATNGGALYNVNSNPELSYCIFTGNAATNAGGAIYNSTSSPSLTNCDLTGNKGSTLAGAMDDTNSTPLVTNSILWNNWTNASASEIADTSSTPTITYSDIQGGYFGTGNINADPKFAAAASPGPDGVWGSYDDYYGRLELMPGSPCIGTASGSADMGCYTFNAGPQITATKLLPEAVTSKEKFQLTTTVIAATTADPVKSVSIYYDTNSDASYDAGDILLGSAKKTSKGWVFNIPADKALSGTSACFIVAQSQSGQKSIQREWLNVDKDPSPSITKFAAEVNVKKSTSSFQLNGTGPAKSVMRVVVAEDSDGNGILDAGDDILYNGKSGHFKKPLNIEPPAATGYLFFAQVENTDGKWSQITDTSAQSS